MPMKKIDLDTLFDMLRYRRPQGSRSQRTFCREFLEPCLLYTSDAADE